jgi:hypothetical protein
LEKPLGLVQHQARDLTERMTTPIVDDDASVIKGKIIYRGCNEGATISGHDYKECIRVERWFVSQGYRTVCRRMVNCTRWNGTDGAYIMKGETNIPV